METVVGELVELCVCDGCTEYVATDRGNCCAQCSVECVCGGRWRSRDERLAAHSMRARFPHETREGVGRPTPSTRTAQPASISMALAAEAFAAALSTGRGVLVRKWGANAVDIGTAATLTAIGVGATMLAKPRRKRRR